MKTAINLVAAFVIAGAALSVNAATYYWKPGATQGLWTNLSNWSTEGVDGADATATPGESDNLDKLSDFNIDLNQGDYTIVGWGSDAGAWEHRNWTISNGRLTITGETRTHSGNWNIETGGDLIFPSGSTFYPGVDVNDPMNVNINNGGSLSVLGTARFYRSIYTVASGGELTFQPTSIRTTSSKANAINNNGILNMPNGMILGQYDTTSGATLTLNQIAGELNLGASIDDTSASNPSAFRVVFSGGTVNVTGDVTFNVTSVALENSVTFNVTSGKTVDLTPVSFASGSSITKTGDGTIILPATAPTATISAGKLALSASTYDLAAVTFEAGSVIELTAMGGRVNSANSSIASATFAATIPATPGTAVLYSTDSTVLTKAKTDLDLSVPTGFDLVISGETLSVEAETAGSFTATGNITESAGWGGTVPAAGSDVAIDGSGVIATYSGGELPAWNSIEVKNGATLRIESDLTLPRIILNKNATLAIGNNAVVMLANIADLAGAVAISPELVIPKLTIESGAMLNVPGGMKFSNVNISLAGTIASTTAGGITFGYAAAGETTYIGLASNGGTISIMPGSGDYNTSCLQFCCPEVGGTVNAAGSLMLANSTILPEYVRSGVTYKLCTDYQIGFYVGVNNSASIPFELVFDNTTWGALGSFYVKGGGTFRLANGGAYRNFESVGYWGRYAQIAENGRIVVGADCEFRMNALGDYGTHALEVLPASTGHQAIIVDDGGIFETYRFSGNDKAVFAASNSVYTIYMPSIYNEHYSQSSQKTTIYDTTNIPFAGFASVDVAQNCTLTFSTRNKVFWDEGQFGDDSGDRVVALADVPITGGGSIALSNDNVNAFGVIVTCGANTATGMAGVVPPAAGKGATTLYFANGANWAGTVVADGNVAMTNLVDAAAAVTNTFGTLRLNADFPIRVWKSGDTIVNDALNVDAYVNNGGKLVLVGDALAPGDTLILGTLADANALPDVKGNWKMSVVDGKLQLKYQSGLSIIFR